MKETTNTPSGLKVYLTETTVQSTHYSSTLHPHYNVLQYNADSVIMQLRSWTPDFSGRSSFRLVGSMLVHSVQQ